LVLTKYSSGKIIWGDKTLQAQAYADDPNPHTHPLAADIDINTMIDGIQSPTLGHPHDGTFGKQIDHANLTDVLATQHPHRHQLYANTAIQYGGPPDPFTTTSTTPVLVTGLSLTGQDPDGVGAIFVSLAASAKVSAGTGYLDFFVDGADQGLAFPVTSTNYQSALAIVSGAFGDNLSHTIDVRVYVDSNTHTLSIAGAQGSGNGTFFSLIGIGTVLNVA
jgi:hypothetical protein